MTNRNTKRGISLPIVLLIVLITILVTLGCSYWFLKTYVFAKEFKPVKLSEKEQSIVDSKLRTLGFQPGENPTETTPPLSHEFDERGVLKPERYSEEGAKREIRFNERELNGILAHNTNLARKLAIDLSENLVSLKLLLPMAPDFPVIGGKTLRFNAGVEMAYVNGKPIVILRGCEHHGCADTQCLDRRPEKYRPSRGVCCRSRVLENLFRGCRGYPCRGRPHPR